MNLSRPGRRTLDEFFRRVAAGRDPEVNEIVRQAPVAAENGSDVAERRARILAEIREEMAKLPRRRRAERRRNA